MRNIIKTENLMRKRNANGKKRKDYLSVNPKEHSEPQEFKNGCGIITYDRKKISGVYFIYNKEGEITYIGISYSDCIKRIQYRKRMIKECDTYSIIKSDNLADIAIMEMYYIAMYNPILNMKDNNGESSISLFSHYPKPEDLKRIKI